MARAVVATATFCVAVLYVAPLVKALMMPTPVTAVPIARLVVPVFSFPRVQEPAKPKAPDIAALIQSLNDPQASKRVTAAAQLGQLGAAAVSAVPALQKAAKDPDVNVRAVAQAALVKIESARKAAGGPRP